jgi:CHAD domain-containing protein
MAPITPRYDLLRKRVERFTRLLHDVDHGSVRAVHRTRVASRRLREVLPVLRLDPKTADRLNRRLRKVTEQLGPVRELDVLGATIEELRLSGRYPSSALARVAAAVRQEREHAHARRTSRLPVRELARIAAKLSKVADEIQASESGSRHPRRARTRSCEWAVEARVARRAGGLGEAIAAAGAVYLPDRIHDVRIALKKLRYALELSVELRGASSSADLKRLREMQDVLGRLHDLQVLVDRVRRIQASVVAPDLTAWHELDRVIITLEEDCRRLHGRYMRNREGLAALAARLAGRARTPAAKRAPAGRVRYA